MSRLYVLGLDNDKYYVGKSDDVDARVRSHMEGRGSAWTARYRPHSLMEIRPVRGPFDEDNLVKEYMRQYGVDQVRGGSYSTIELDLTARVALQREFRTAANACFQCGQLGHWAGDCHAQRRQVPDPGPARPRPAAAAAVVGPAASRTVDVGVGGCDQDRCYSCGHLGHWAAQCDQESGPDSDSDGDCCYRCGRAGHWANQCYARYHVNGSRL